MKKPNMPSMPTVPKFDFRTLAEDFKSLDPKDIGTWPLLPRVTMLLGVFAALLVAGWWFDWKSQLEELDGKQQQEAKLKDEYLDKKRQAVNLEEHRKQLAEIDKSFGALLKQLPNKAEMEALLIDINQATTTELEMLPGIGPTMAANIVAYREANGPFATIEAIMDVPGIGEGRFAEMKDLITVGP